MNIYFPSQFVDQEKLETFDNVSKGKYTVGLGQSKMSFCLDNEDINSICLTALNNLLEKYSIKPDEVGYLEVGTETLIDKSKSVKTTLTRLFENNPDMEGVDSLNACFGGTAALFHAVNWITSDYWDGRFAVVVMGDIAIYEKGNARPTGGAGAIAFLLGPNAPLVFERGLRTHHFCDAYDFYKPVMDSEYPIVDGQLSIKCYLNALDNCYQSYKKKFNSLKDHLHDLNNNNGIKFSQDVGGFNLNSASAFLFHSPYCKLVQKSFARLLWNDYLDETLRLNDNAKNIESRCNNLEQFK
jgi:hydroxymethylglutaryl-CoA synthase